MLPKDAARQKCSATRRPQYSVLAWRKQEGKPPWKAVSGWLAADNRKGRRTRKPENATQTAVHPDVHSALRPATHPIAGENNETVGRTEMRKKIDRAKTMGEGRWQLQLAEQPAVD
jgi:hypothetical protein